MGHSASDTIDAREAAALLNAAFHRPEALAVVRWRASLHAVEEQETVVAQKLLPTFLAALHGQGARIKAVL